MKASAALSAPAPLSALVHRVPHPPQTKNIRVGLAALPLRGRFWPHRQKKNIAGGGGGLGRGGRNSPHGELEELRLPTSLLPRSPPPPTAPSPREHDRGHSDFAGTITSPPQDKAAHQHASPPITKRFCCVAMPRVKSPHVTRRNRTLLSAANLGGSPPKPPVSGAVPRTPDYLVAASMPRSGLASCSALELPIPPAYARVMPPLPTVDTLALAHGSAVTILRSAANRYDRPGDPLGLPRGGMPRALRSHSSTHPPASAPFFCPYGAACRPYGAPEPPLTARQTPPEPPYAVKGIRGGLPTNSPAALDKPP